MRGPKIHAAERDPLVEVVSGERHTGRDRQLAGQARGDPYPGQVRFISLKSLGSIDNDLLGRPAGRGFWLSVQKTPHAVHRCARIAIDSRML
jgi:hypothetical protein